MKYCLVSHTFKQVIRLKYILFPTINAGIPYSKCRTKELQYTVNKMFTYHFTFIEHICYVLIELKRERKLVLGIAAVKYSLSTQPNGKDKYCFDYYF